MWAFVWCALLHRCGPDIEVIQSFDGRIEEHRRRKAGNCRTGKGKGSSKCVVLIQYVQLTERILSKCEETEKSGSDAAILKSRSQAPARRSRVGRSRRKRGHCGGREAMSVMVLFEKMSPESAAMRAF